MIKVKIEIFKSPPFSPTSVKIAFGLNTKDAHDCRFLPKNFKVSLPEDRESLWLKNGILQIFVRGLVGKIGLNPDTFGTILANV